jgi:hypothetical protein
LAGTRYENECEWVGEGTHHRKKFKGTDHLKRVWPHEGVLESVLQHDFPNFYRVKSFVPKCTIYRRKLKAKGH